MSTKSTTSKKSKPKAEKEKPRVIAAPSRPVVTEETEVDSIVWDGSNTAEVIQFGRKRSGVNVHDKILTIKNDPHRLVVETLIGFEKISKGVTIRKNKEGNLSVEL